MFLFTLGMGRRPHSLLYKEYSLRIHPTASLSTIVTLSRLFSTGRHIKDHSNVRRGSGWGHNKTVFGFLDFVWRQFKKHGVFPGGLGSFISIFFLFFPMKDRLT
jgi:hypothetical protein